MLSGSPGHCGHCSSRSPPGSSILSTIAIAALFTPLRRRVQNGIDHRFYRRKYDAARVLAGFGVTVRDEVDLNRLTDELLTVVEETMQPTNATLWLKDGAPSLLRTRSNAVKREVTR